MDYLRNLEENLHEICQDCTNHGTEKCKSTKCNIGFALYVIRYAKGSSVPIIENGEKLIPRDDLRYYDEGSIANGIANICKLCKECNEHHNEECVLSLIRRSLENTQLTESVIYPGNILAYLMNVSKENPKFAELIRKGYMEL